MTSGNTLPNPESRGGEINRSWRIFSGSSLKYFVALLMLGDHIAQMFPASPQLQWLHIPGRLVMPVFIFMCAEGFYHTHDRGRYMLRLLIGYEVMNIVSSLLGRLMPVEWTMGAGGEPARVILMNGAFGTMLVMCILLWSCSAIYRSCKEKRPKQAALGLSLLLGYIALSAGMALLMPVVPPSMAVIFFHLATAIPTPFFVEGTGIILVGVLFYALRRWRWAQILPLAALAVSTFVAEAHDMGLPVSFQSMLAIPTSWATVFAAVPILLYNGKRGGGSPRFNKWFFYIFYPAHIYALYILAWFLQC